MGAAIAGAGRIVAVDRVPAKLDLARTVGATDAVLAGADAAATIAAIRDADRRRARHLLRGDRAAGDDRAGDRLPADRRHGLSSSG